MNIRLKNGVTVLFRMLSPRPARCMLQSNWQNEKKL
ncbi:hypothetical protein FOPG_18110 [Fusarium oxysporum f. sp. conglutinans race 2 54008]|uniref:Uncharacterized protein n=1 Tax=Fusarium oxysporum f. sp. conglutinans race 2 54008 TaxID=1089457 RepID=X0HX06_FUSOX|nr:hypothetical protein FOPG_18110 [Fusarium oxysporum f. sp. conglutinans race 2 54008]